MPTMPERLAVVEVHLANHGIKLEDIGTKVDELHAHFLQNKGAAAERAQRRSVRQTIVTVITATVGACGALFGIIRGLQTH